MKKLILIICLLGFAGHNFSQNTPKIFFDKNWDLSNENKFKYYRIIDNSKDSLTVLDYYKNGNLQSKVICSKNDTILDLIKYEGNIPDSLTEIVSYYDKKGRIIYTSFNNPTHSKTQFPAIVNDSLETGRYEIDDLTYIKYYRKSGHISWESFQKEDAYEGIYLEYYGKKGNYQLAAIAINHNDLLTGTVINKYPDGDLMMTTEYEKGVKEGKCVLYDGYDNVRWIKIYKNGRLVKKTLP